PPAPPAVEPAPAAAPGPTPLAARAPGPQGALARHGDRTGLDVDAPHGRRDDYAARLRVWLEAHKVYPRRARLRREEGVVEVRFIVDRQGRLLDGGILRSSGHASLDAEALAMLARSEPFPAAPRHMAGERFEVSAPVAFSLER
ncbi:MAG: energy transducer TonB, partial [Phenylobacterium sp.]|uniref:energy transducer TonB n=1 Tax=Phenylobacterium sp. TaxID=1871053 RepID=UPI00391C8149